MTDSQKKLILNNITEQYPQEKVENYILFVVEKLLNVELIFCSVFQNRTDLNEIF